MESLKLRSESGKVKYIVIFEENEAKDLENDKSEYYTQLRKHITKLKEEPVPESFWDTAEIPEYEEELIPDLSSFTVNQEGVFK